MSHRQTQVTTHRLPPFARPGPALRASSASRRLQPAPVQLAAPRAAGGMRDSKGELGRGTEGLPVQCQIACAMPAAPVATCAASLALALNWLASWFPTQLIVRRQSITCIRSPSSTSISSRRWVVCSVGRRRARLPVPRAARRLRLPPAAAHARPSPASTSTERAAHRQWSCAAGRRGLLPPERQDVPVAWCALVTPQPHAGAPCRVPPALLPSCPPALLLLPSCPGAGRTRRRGTTPLPAPSHPRAAVPLIGTFSWIAPEVLLGKAQVDQSADVYSFGVVMWEVR